MHTTQRIINSASHKIKIALSLFSDVHPACPLCWFLNSWVSGAVLRAVPLGMKRNRWSITYSRSRHDSSAGRFFLQWWCDKTVVGIIRKVMEHREKWTSYSVKNTDFTEQETFRSHFEDCAEVQEGSKVKVKMSITWQQLATLWSQDQYDKGSVIKI